MRNIISFLKSLRAIFPAACGRFFTDVNMDPKEWAAGYDDSDEVDSLATEDAIASLSPLLLLGMRLAYHSPVSDIRGRQKPATWDVYRRCGQHSNPGELSGQDGCVGNTPSETCTEVDIDQGFSVWCVMILY